MYLYQVIHGPDAAEFCETKLNLDPAKYDLGSVKRLELFSASIADDGEDYLEVRVIDSADTVIAVRRVLEF